MPRYRIYKNLDRDPLVAQAQIVVDRNDGVYISATEKAKNLSKFGKNSTVGTAWETVAQLQGSESHETFVTSNIIDSIVSSSGSDTTQLIQVEGFTVDSGGDMTFVTQETQLQGQTPTALTTHLARATRAYVKPEGVFGDVPAAIVGTVSIYDNTDGETSGVPDTDAATKLIISAGETQSQKAATTISSTDYWLIKNFYASIGSAGGSGNWVEVRMETRDIAAGGAWIPTGETIVVFGGGDGGMIVCDPLVIVPSNHDWRMVAKANANTAEVFAGARGVLATTEPR